MQPCMIMHQKNVQSICTCTLMYLQFLRSEHRALIKQIQTCTIAAGVCGAMSTHEDGPNAHSTSPTSVPGNRASTKDTHGNHSINIMCHANTFVTKDARAAVFCGSAVELLNPVEITGQNEAAKEVQINLYSILCMVS